MCNMNRPISNSMFIGRAGFPSLPGRAPLLRWLHVRYAVSMSESPSNSSSAGSLGRMIVAILVLLVVGYFLLHVLIGVAVAVAGFAVVILAVVAVIWALRVIL